MQLILVRHGDAGAYTLPDNERNLSELGKQQAQQTAQWLINHYQPDMAIVSPYNRAKQTLSAITNLTDIPVHIYDKITPDDEAENAIQGLYEFAEKYQPKCLLVVCHMNIIAYMASLLTGDMLDSFSLAEARVYETKVIAHHLATEIKRFIPTN